MMVKARAVRPVQAFVLGTFELTGSGGPIRLSTRRLEALLTWLLLHPGPHAREKLAALVWGDARDARARNSLRNGLALLRKELGAELLLADRELVQLNPRFPIRVDALLFRAQAEQFLAALSPAPGQVDLTLYRGELLRDCYDDWVVPERELYRNLHLDTLLRLIQLMRARSDYAQAIVHAQHVLALDPANERAHQHLMFCYLAAGQRSEALKQFEACRRLLAAELGVEPAAETQALHAWLRQSAPEVQSSAARITNLPIAFSSFVGREREMAQVKRLLQRGRLVTLTGAGGSGKTRLAVQVGTDLVDAFEDGVWWVDLGPLRDETLVPHAVAKALGVQERRGQPLAEGLRAALHGRRLLLLLDNCEHLIAACARIAEMLLAGCPQLHILATSREPLTIGGEAVWQVPTLSLPPDPALSASDAGLVSARDIDQSEAVRLFVARATAARAEFVLNDAVAPAIAQICLRLDGIPLAIELAAARVKVLSPEEIAARVGDRFALLAQNGRGVLPRQQTLRALFDWSYDLLSEQERLLFRRVAVFHGGRTLDAALAVCAGDGIDPLTVLELLSRLVDKSLLQASDVHGQTRYRFLETVRQYAVERLAESGEQERLRERHASYCIALAETGHEKLRGDEQSVWLNRLEADHDNLRMALAWARAAGRLELALQLAGALWIFWYLHGDWVEGSAWLDGLLLEFERERGSPRGEQLPPPLTALLARALHGAGLLGESQGELARSQRRLQDSVLLWRRLGDERGLARALNGLGETSFYLSRYGEAQACFAESLLLWRRQAYEHGTAIALSNLSGVRREQGAHGEADALLRESLQIWRLRGDRRGIAEAMAMQAHNALARGDYERARVGFDECLTNLRELRMKNKEAQILNGLAQIARVQGDYTGSRALSRESLAVSREQGGRRDIAQSLHNLARVSLHEAGIAEAEEYLREALRLSVAGENLPGIVLACMAAAQAALGRGQAERAVRLLAGAETLLKGIGAQTGEPDRGEAALTLAAARAQLGAARFAVVWQAGVHASQAELVAEALG